ncbi:MAG: homoserine dehydrogenase [candidate division Zixibacteria bacterium]|nr:homoserine dehydrogenase [candidate division Zixibacteria bacterium]
MRVRIALLGFGPVGRSFAEIVADRASELERRYGVWLSITAAVDRTGGVVDPDGLDAGLLVQAKRAGSVAGYPGKGRLGLGSLEALSLSHADIALEATSVNLKDGEPGLTHVRMALSSGRHVVIANKAPLVLAYPELLSLARRYGVALKFSATLGGSLPTYNLGARDLAGCVIERVDAILNGTSHYILSRMNAGDPYETALREAQRLEIAERDPRLDVEGWDAASKLVILANSILNIPARLEDIAVTGITHLGREDLPLTMLGVALRRPDGGYTLKVGPERLSQDHPLAHLPPLSMGIVFHTDLVGPMAITVNERGPKPTAAAMLRDVLEIVRKEKK